jgi:hypothetical protein
VSADRLEHHASTHDAARDEWRKHVRAEEGDETVNDYAKEGKLTHDRIKDAQRAASPWGRVVARIAKFFRGGDSPGGNH